jgi:TolB-like protein/DNA-binding winged helix-turn-helix (wHTH) protein/Tfp pilus assembly protein PilF
MTQSSTSARRRFGPFQLDLQTGDLVRNGRCVALQGKPRSILIALVEQGGTTVSRAELQTRLWPDETFVDFEDGLNTAMRKLREVLGDDPQNSRYIQTVRGVGYRFIAPIQEMEPTVEAVRTQPITLPVPLLPASALTEAAQPTSPTAAGAAFGRSTRNRLLIALGAVALLVATVYAVRAVRLRSVAAERISIAVLPFANLTGDPSRDYLANGITDELISRLDHLNSSHLRVIAPTSSRLYAGSAVPAAQIGRQLGVQYLIVGSLQQQGANVRLAVQLLRVSDESRPWANTYDGDLSQQFEFETSVADSVCQALSIKVPDLARGQYQPGKYEAHDAYLKGIFAVSLRSRAGLQQGIEDFSQAVSIDPRYAEAYAMLANTYNLMGQYTWMKTDEARGQGLAAARQALALDPNLPEAHAAMGFSEWFYLWTPAVAEREFRTAIALNPSNRNAHHWYAQMLMTEGRFSEAEQQMNDALDVDPRSPILRTNLGWLHYFEGHSSQASTEIEQVVRENPDFLTAHYKLWYVYSASGDQDDGWKQFQWVMRWDAGNGKIDPVLEAYRKAGYRAALNLFPGIEDGSDGRGSLVESARCMAFAGNSEGALEYLARARAAREGWMIFVARDPAFAALRSDSRFQKLAQLDSQ